MQNATVVASLKISWKVNVCWLHNFHFWVNYFFFFHYYFIQEQMYIVSIKFDKEDKIKMQAYMMYDCLF